MRASSVSWLRRGARRVPLRSAWRRDSSVDADERPKVSVQLALAVALVGVPDETSYALAEGSAISGELACISMAATSGRPLGVEGAIVIDASAGGGSRAAAGGLSLALALVPVVRTGACAAGGDARERRSLASSLAVADEEARRCVSFALPLDLELALAVELALDGAGLAED